MKEVGYLPWKRPGADGKYTATPAQSVFKFASKGKGGGKGGKGKGKKGSKSKGKGKGKEGGKGKKKGKSKDGSQRRPQKEIPCRFFFKSGGSTCKNGNKCGWSHNPAHKNRKATPCVPSDSEEGEDDQDWSEPEGEQDDQDWYEQWQGAESESEYFYDEDADIYDEEFDAYYAGVEYTPDEN